MRTSRMCASSQVAYERGTPLGARNQPGPRSFTGATQICHRTATGRKRNTETQRSQRRTEESVLAISLARAGLTARRPTSTRHQLSWARRGTRSGHSTAFRWSRLHPIPIRVRQRCRRKCGLRDRRNNRWITDGASMKIVEHILLGEGHARLVVLHGIVGEYL